MAGQLVNLPKRLPAVKDWLRAAGAEVLEPTNEWEVLRFRAGGVTHVVYRNARGFMNMAQATRHIVDCFLGGQPWSAGVAVERRRYSTDERALLKRDGDCCFLCWGKLRDDVTVEHLVAVTHGGPNHIANKALAHKGCNARMGNLSAMEKVRMREANRPGSEERMAA